jgi:hypothetical protein
LHRSCRHNSYLIDQVAVFATTTLSATSPPTSTTITLPTSSLLRVFALLATLYSFNTARVDFFALVIVPISCPFRVFFASLFAVARSSSNCFLVALASLSSFLFAFLASSYFLLRAFATRLILQSNLAYSLATLSASFLT